MHRLARRRGEVGNSTVSRLLLCVSRLNRELKCKQHGFIVPYICGRLSAKYVTTRRVFCAPSTVLLIFEPLGLRGYPVLGINVTDLHSVIKWGACLWFWLKEMGRFQLVARPKNAEGSEAILRHVSVRRPSYHCMYVVSQHVNLEVLTEEFRIF